MLKTFQYDEVFNDEFESSVTDSCDNYSNSSREENKMTTKTKPKRTTKKPILIKCGNHYINPTDIRKITKIEKFQKPLYAIDFISAPNPDFTCWVKEDDINMLLEHFELIVSDD